MNKKGVADSTWSFTLSLIVGIMIVALFLTLTLSYFAEQQKVTDSFNKLITVIENLEDGDSGKIIYQLPEEYALLAFTDSKEFTGDSVWNILDTECTENVDLPFQCQDSGLCFAVCNANWMVDFDSACTDGLVANWQPEQSYTVYDTTCDSGFWREGTDSGVFTLYYRRDGNILRFSDNKYLVGEKDEEISTYFENLVANWQICQSNKDDCSCNLDPKFLKDDYAINFYADHADLWKIKGETIVTTALFDTGVSILSGTDEEGTLDDSEYISMYIVSTTSGSSLVLSSDTEDIEPKILLSEDRQVPVSYTLYFKDDKMAFTKDYYDLSELSACNKKDINEEERVSFIA